MLVLGKMTMKFNIFVCGNAAYVFNTFFELNTEINLKPIVVYMYMQYCLGTKLYVSSWNFEEIEYDQAYFLLRPLPFHSIPLFFFFPIFPLSSHSLFLTFYMSDFPLLLKLICAPSSICLRGVWLINFMFKDVPHN